MGNDASTLDDHLEHALEIPNEIWDSEWHMLKLAAANQKQGDYDSSDTKDDKEMNTLKVKYEDMVLYENYIQIRDSEVWPGFWTMLDKNLGLHDNADKVDHVHKRKTYAVVVHSYVFFFNKKQDYDKALQANTIPIRPLGIDLYSEELQVKLREDSFTLFRLTDDHEPLRICDINDVTLGKFIAEASTRNPENRNASTALFANMQVATADGEDDDPSDDIEDSEAADLFGDLSHAMQNKNQAKMDVYKKGALIFKQKKVFCALQFGMLLMYKNEEAMNDIHKRPWRIIDLHHASFDKEDSFIQEEFGFLNCVVALGDESSDDDDDEEADEAKEEGIEEADEDHHDRLPQKMIIFYIKHGKKYRKTRKYTMEAETDAEGIQWKKSIELMIDYITTDTSNDHRYVDIEDIVKCCRTGDLLLMKGKKMSCRVIRALTRSPYDHVAMTYSLRKKKYFFDSTGDGVCMHPLLKFINKKWYKPYRKTVYRRLHFIKVEEGKDPEVDTEYYKSKFEKLNHANLDSKREDDIPDVTLKAFTEFASNNIGKAYNISMKKYRQATGMVKSDVGDANSKEGMFCSELIASAYMHTNILPSADVHAAAYYYPGSFSEKRNLQFDVLEIAGEKYIVKLGREFPVDWQGFTNPNAMASTCMGRRD